MVLPFHINIRLIISLTLKEIYAKESDAVSSLVNLLSAAWSPKADNRSPSGIGCTHRRENRF